jgi:hypothetical protein
MSMKLQFAMLGSAALLCACASQEPEPLLISSIEVDADLTAVDSPGAVTYWKNLSDDLETAIASQFAGSIDPSGHPLTVDIDELSLSESYAAGSAIDNASLSGLVTLGDIVPDARPDTAYTVTATASDAVPYMDSDGNTGVSATSAEYYKAIVQAFARGTAQTLRSGS